MALDFDYDRTTQDLLRPAGYLQLGFKLPEPFVAQKMFVTRVQF